MSAPTIHLARRDNKYSAAHHFRAILANDDRPRTMHAEAERTGRHLLPEIVCDLLERQEHRRYTRQRCWQDHLRSVGHGRPGVREWQPQPNGPRLEMETDGLEL